MGSDSETTELVIRPRRGDDTDGVSVNLETTPEALIALAEMLGEIAADLWLDEEIDCDEGHAVATIDEWPKTKC